MVPPCVSSPHCDDRCNEGYQNTQLRFNLESDHRDNQPSKRDAFRPTSAACLEFSEPHAASRKQQTTLKPRQPTRFCPPHNTRLSDLYTNSQRSDKAETACLSSATHRTFSGLPNFHSTPHSSNRTTQILSSSTPRLFLFPNINASDSEEAFKYHNSSVWSSIQIQVLRPSDCTMSISSDKQNAADAVDKPCLHPADGTPWEMVKKELEGIQKCIDAILDAQAHEIDLSNFRNRMFVEMEKCAQSINDRSKNEVDHAISAAMSVARKVTKTTQKDMNKIEKTADNAKRDKKLDKALKSVDGGMLDITAPLLGLPRSNVFRETTIRCALPMFDDMRELLSTEIREAHKSASSRHKSKNAYSCVVA